MSFPTDAEFDAKAKEILAAEADGKAIYHRFQWQVQIEEGTYGMSQFHLKMAEGFESAAAELRA